MRIGIEGSTLTRSRAGIGFYTYHLVKALAQQAGEEEYALLYNRPLSLELPNRLRHVLNGPTSTHLWVQTRLASICRKQGIDLLHSPGQGIPLLYEGPTILTIHDLSPLLFPQQKEFWSRLIWNCFVPMMARQVDHIITVSENTRRDVLEYLGLPESRVTRIYEAAGSDYFPETDAAKLQQFRKDRQLESGYILAVGTLEPRKNYPFLFRTFAHWRETAHSEAQLVVVGKKGWLYDDIFRTVEELSLQSSVRFLGYVEDMETMRLYYSAAEFTILAPIYEGFWLPGLESLACGTPVIAPNRSSIPEVIGDSGWLMDTWEAEEWLIAMNRLWQSCERSQWRERALAQAKKFSWDQAAQETLAVYRSVRNSVK